MRSLTVILSHARLLVPTHPRAARKSHSGRNYTVRLMWNIYGERIKSYILRVVAWLSPRSNFLS
jgi:hypothetical protein